MTLKKAIEIKENHQRLHLDEYYSELLEADNLSIEALKAFECGREGLRTEFCTPLIGETKE